MDDVIERMARGMCRNIDGNDFQWKLYVDDVIASLRAVSDSHRLVPVEPTTKMAFSKRHGFLEKPPSSIWSDMLDLAPDYTETPDG